MNLWTEAERYMMDQVRRGDDDAWSELVERYQGRLIAFARSRVAKSVDPEDLVQDTFMLFLRALDQFREQATIETFLFTILRRRLAEVHRGKRIHVCELPPEEDSKTGGRANLASPQSSASVYVRRDEQKHIASAALGSALNELVERLKSVANLPELQMLEMVFYGQQSNQRIAAELSVPATQVATLKHRWIKQLREHVERSMRASALPWDSPDGIDSLLTQTWEELRPSCPKRSTVGGYVLGTLEVPWQRYVDFHIHRLGCCFCRASLTDLQSQSKQDAGSLRQKIMQSTVGFLPKA